VLASIPAYCLSGSNLRPGNVSPSPTLWLLEIIVTWWMWVLVSTTAQSNRCVFVHDAAGCENIVPSFVWLVWIGVEALLLSTYDQLRICRDIEMMDHITSSSPLSFFTQKIVCSKINIWWRKRERMSSTSWSWITETERERVKALAGKLRYHIEQDAIKGTIAEIAWIECCRYLDNSSLKLE